jgi:hypothetical protein
MERDLGALEVVDRKKVTLEFKPFEIHSLVVR